MSLFNFQTPRAGFITKLRLAAFGFGFTLALLLACVPANAVTLRQKWVPGQQLTYDTTVAGTLTLLADDESPQPWAGLPIDFRMRGNSAVTLDTLSVDEFGIGTVALRVGDSRVRAQGFGQVFEMNVKEGRANATMNGKPAGATRLLNLIGEPRMAFRLAPEGRLEGVVPLKTQAQDNNPKDDGLPFDFSAALQSWLLRALPTLWPKGEVKEGEQWTAPLIVPLNQKPTAQEKPPVPVGQVNFTLRGEEDIVGRKAHRISLTGAFDVDEAKAKTLGEAARHNLPETKPDVKPNDVKPNNAKKEPGTTMDLATAKQKLTGDLWLDVASGQLVRAEVALQTALHSKGTITNKAGRTRPTENWADFDGSLQMQLRKVSYSSAQAP